MSNFTRNMDFTAEFLKGWPVDAGLELDYPVASGVTLSAGDLVKPYYNSGVTFVTPVVAGDATAGVQALTAAANRAGIVVRGNGDDKSCAASGKAIVLWGHYIVRTQKFDTVTITSAGVEVIAGHGTSAATTAAADGIFVASGNMTATSSSTAISIPSIIMGQIATTVLTVTTVAGLPLKVGDAITGPGVTSGTTITALGSGTGGAGTYTVNHSQSVDNGSGGDTPIFASATTTPTITSSTTATVPGMGYVLEYQAAGGGQPAQIIVVVK